jgi:hypothetical protein
MLAEHRTASVPGQPTAIEPHTGFPDDDLLRVKQENRLVTDFSPDRKKRRGQQPVLALGLADAGLDKVDIEPLLLGDLDNRDIVL